MILFVNKADGKIIGTIDGRVHSEAHLKMWIGDRDKTERIIISWKPIIDGQEEVEQEVLQKVGKDESGQELFKIVKAKGMVEKKHWEPDCGQKDLMMDIDRRRKKITDFKIDLKTKRLIPIEMSK